MGAAAGLRARQGHEEAPQGTLGAHRRHHGHAAPARIGIIGMGWVGSSALPRCCARRSTYTWPMHARPADEVLAALGSGAQGLSSSEAAARLAQHGPNA